MPWNLESGILSLRSWLEEICALAGPGPAVGLTLSWELMTKPLCLKAVEWVCWVSPLLVLSFPSPTLFLWKLGALNFWNSGLKVIGCDHQWVANLGNGFVTIKCLSICLKKEGGGIFCPPPLYNHLHLCFCIWEHCFRSVPQNNCSHLAWEGVLFISKAD